MMSLPRASVPLDGRPLPPPPPPSTASSDESPPPRFTPRHGETCQTVTGTPHMSPPLAPVPLNEMVVITVRVVVPPLTAPHSTPPPLQTLGETAPGENGSRSTRPLDTAHRPCGEVPPMGETASGNAAGEPLGAPPLATQRLLPPRYRPCVSQRLPHVVPLIGDGCVPLPSFPPP